MTDVPPIYVAPPSTVFDCRSRGESLPDNVDYLVLLAKGDIPNVMLFGAVGNGEADDTAAIQSAINVASSPSGTGIILFPALPFLISNTLTIGNGTTGAVSTLNGVILTGMGVPPPPPEFFTGYNQAADNCTRIIWGGGAAPMIKVLGPLQGWGLQNLYLDGAGAATHGVYVVSASYGSSRNLTVRRCLSAGIASTTVPVFGPSSNNMDSLHNVWEQIAVAVPAVDQASGIVLTGQTTSNTDYNTFKSVAVALPTVLGGGQKAYGIYLQACDSNLFENIHMFNGSPTQTFPLALDYTVNSSWPSGNRFTSFDWGPQTNPISVKGSPAANSSLNTISPNPVNGSAFAVTNIPELANTPAITSAVKLVSNNVPIANSVLAATNTVDGLYKVSFYLVVTGGTGSAGTIQITINWLDGFGAPSFASATAATGAGSMINGSVVIRINNFSATQYSVIYSGVAGTPIYDLFMSLERLL